MVVNVAGTGGTVSNGSGFRLESSKELRVGKGAWEATAMTVPSSMSYVGLSEQGCPDNLAVTEGRTPHPRSGELLVRVEAAGINLPDVLQRKGDYPPPPDASPILGLEIAGEVVAIGDDVTGYEIGDKVCALANGG